MMANEGRFDVSTSEDAQFLMLAIANSGTGLWDRDVATGRIFYSKAWKAILGYQEHEIGERIEDSYTRVHPDDLAMVQASIAAHFDQHTECYAVEHRLRCKDGSYKWVLSRGKVMARDAQGQPLRMIGVTTDITDTHALSARLRDSAELLINLTNEVPGLVYQYRKDADGFASFTYASAGIAAMFGVTPALAAQDAAAVEAAIHPDDLPAYHDSLAVSAATLTRWHLQFRVLIPGLGERWREGDARPRALPDGSTVWHGFIADITDHKQLEMQLEDAAATDFLTGLPNRRHIMMRMGQELARVQRDGDALAAVLIFDLDRFKAINDEHGHAMGDEVLKHVAQLLTSELRKVDSVGRIGGEEFAIILGGADLEDAMRFAERVRGRLEQSPLRLDAVRIDLTVSIGVAAMLASDAAIADSLSRADEALYLAKHRGRNRVQVARG